MVDNFCEYEIKESAIKTKDADAFEKIGCVGSFEESFNTKEIIKKCEGIVKEKRTKPDGTGELKLSMHMKWQAYVDMYSLKREKLKDGVYAYGSAQHKVFTYVCKALDMDGEVKYKAYPNCVVSDGIARKIENGGEEVAEVELTIAVSADEYGEVMYEAPEKDITDETVKTRWMTDWNRELVEKGA